jgi:outer membrane protein assembly factor BamB
MRILPFAFLFWAGLAHGDASLAGDGAGLPAKCSYEDGPYFRARASAVVKAESEKRKVSFRHAGRKHLLFSRGWRDEPNRSIVLDTSGKLVRELPFASAAVVEDAAGALVGLLAVDDTTGALTLHDAVSGAVRWRYLAKGRSDDSAATLVAGDQLVLGQFHRIATGSRLISLDLASGALRWTAEVEQVNAAHSEYFNDVALELSGGDVIMRGTEASGCYVQRFDAATGRRKRSLMKRGW